MVAPLHPVPLEMPVPNVQKNQMTNPEIESRAKTVLAGFMLLPLPFLMT